jgi:hypothetical protein
VTLDEHGLAAWLDLVLRRPLRPTATPPAGESARQRGFWCGVDEAAREMAELLGVQAEPAEAFGGRWWAAFHEGVVVAPGVPVAVSAEEQLAPGGAYRLNSRGAVLREGGSGEAPELERRHAVSAPRAELVWFDDNARHVVWGGQLLVDDLFSRLELPATRARLDHLLVRRLRLDGRLLDGIREGENAGAARLTVQAPAGPAIDPGQLLRARLDLTQVEELEDGWIARHVDGSELRFRLVDAAGATWRVLCADDPRGIASLRVDPEQVVAELAPTLDPLRPGWRTRLAFDLRADLTAAGQKV